MAAAKKSNYEVLEISPDANFEEIRQAYKRLCLKWHPDKNPENTDEATEKMQEIVQAYGALKKKFDGGNHNKIYN